MPQTPQHHDVLDAYTAAGPSLERLKTWAKAYPQHHDALTTLTVDWLVSDWEDELHQEAAPHKTEVARAILDAAQALTPAADRPAEEAAPEATASEGPETNAAASLKEELLSGGKDLPEVLAAAHLSFDLFAMLNSGLLSFANDAVRDQVATVLAAAAGIAVLRVQRRLQALQPHLGAGASCTDEKPQVTTQDFFEAVEEDEDLANEDRAFWRAIRPASCTA